MFEVHVFVKFTCSFISTVKHYINGKKGIFINYHLLRCCVKQNERWNYKNRLKTYKNYSSSEIRHTSPFCFTLQVWKICKKPPSNLTPLHKARVYNILLCKYHYILNMYHTSLHQRPTQTITHSNASEFYFIHRFWWVWYCFK